MEKLNIVCAVVAIMIVVFVLMQYETRYELAQFEEKLHKKVNKLNQIVDALTNRTTKLEEKYQDSSLKLAGLNIQHNEDIQVFSNQINSMSNQLNDFNQTFVSDYVKKKNLTVYSLAHNVSIGDMKSQSYKIVYDLMYSKETSFAELDAIKSKCLHESVLCAGGGAVGSDNLLLVSCGNCKTVLSTTLQNKPVLSNGAYWYFSGAWSFGFSPSFSVIQADTDVYDCYNSGKYCADDKRLSWWMVHDCSSPTNDKGARLGKLNNYRNNMNEYRKVILISF